MGSTGTRFAIAALVSALLLGGVALAVVRAYHPVRPHLQCIMPLGNGATVAFFGYENEKDEPVAVPVGDDNWFEPGAFARGQTTTFPPGSTPRYPDSAFSVTFKGERLVWHLGPRDVVVTRESPRCPMPAGVTARPSHAVVLPKRPEPPPQPKPEPTPPEPKPQEKVAEKPDPTKEPTRKPLNQVDKRGQVKPKTPPKAAETKAPEPIPLQLEGLTKLSKGVNIQTGDNTVLGDPEVDATDTNTNIEPVDDVRNVPEKVGDGTGGSGQVVKCTAPRIRRRVEGVYPDDAPRLGRAVLVRLLLTVAEDGTVSNVSVTRSAGGAFDREALSVGKRLTFAPAECNGQPVEKRIPWVVEFTPDEW